MSTKNLIVFDLSGLPDAASELEAFEPCLSAYHGTARRVGTAVVKPLPQRFVPDTTPVERAAVRAWARENGHRLSPYGQIPNTVHRAYAAAHSEAAS